MGENEKKPGILRKFIALIRLIVFILLVSAGVLGSEPFEQLYGDLNSNLELYNDLKLDEHVEFVQVDIMKQAENYDMETQTVNSDVEIPAYGHSVSFNTNLKYDDREENVQHIHTMQPGELFEIYPSDLHYNTESPLGKVMLGWESVTTGKKLKAKDNPHKLSDTGFGYQAVYKDSFAQSLAEEVPAIKPVKNALTDVMTPLAKKLSDVMGWNTKPRSEYKPS